MWAATLILASLILFLLYTICIYNAGLLFLKSFQGKVTQNRLLSYVVGHALIASYLQLLATFNILNLVFTLPIFLLVLFQHSEKTAVIQKIYLYLKSISPRKNPIEILCLILIGMCGIASISYPGTDALAYYMAQPKLIAAKSGFAVLPGYEVFSTLPLLSEIHYSLFYLIGRDIIGQITSKFFMYSHLPLICLLVFKIGELMKLPRVRKSILLAFIISSSAINLVSWDGKTDLVSFSYALTALACLIMTIQNESSSYSIAFGSLAALAICSKLSYALTLPINFLIITFFYIFKSPRKILKLYVIATLAAVATCSITWWFKNYVLFSDPFAPIFYLQESTPKFPLDQSWFGEEETRWITSTYPLAITFGLYPMQHGGISSIWLLAFPLVFSKNLSLRDAFSRFDFQLFVAGILGLALWLIFRPSVLAPRYFLPTATLPIFFLLLQSSNCSRLLEKVFRVSVIGILLITCLQMINIHRHEVKRYFKYLESPSNGSIPQATRAFELSTKIGPSSKILLLSYSSENLPVQLLKSFISHFEAPKEGFWEWCVNKDVNFIVLDANTHSVPDLPKHFQEKWDVKRYEYAKDLYYLYSINRNKNIENSRLKDD